MVLSISIIGFCGLLAFVTARRFGRRGGLLVVGAVALLNLPGLLPFAAIRAEGVSAEVEAYAAFTPPDRAGLGAIGYMALGALTFAGATLLSAALGATLGTRIRGGAGAW